MLSPCVRYLESAGIDLFFFSSRRRHTRYWRDWSSDVCSSDLHVMVPSSYRSIIRRRPDIGGYGETHIVQGGPHGRRQVGHIFERHQQIADSREEFTEIGGVPAHFGREAFFVFLPDFRRRKWLVRLAIGRRRR